MSHRAKYGKRKIKNVKCRRDRKRNLRKKIETKKAKLSNETQKIGKNSKFQAGSFDPKSIYEIPPNFGTTEFICGADFDSIISKIIIYLAFIGDSETENYIFSSINIITPPTEDYEDHKVWNIIFESFEKLSGLKLQDKYKRNIESRINVIKTKLLTKTSIDLILDKIDSGSAFILLDSHFYVDINSDEVHSNLGLSEILLEEDYLAPNLSDLNRELTIKSKIREIYGVICTRKNPPEKEYNRNLLVEVEDCFPIFFETENDINSIVAKNTQIWYDTLITEGENSTRAKIINVGVSESEIDLILAQLWHRNGNTKELKIKLNSIIKDINSYDPSTCLKIAGMYIKCNPNEITTSVSLIPEANLLNEKRFLYYGLLLSTELLNNDLIDSYFMKLSSSNPEDAYLRSNVEERMLIVSSLSENENITKIGFTEKDLNFINILKCSNADLDKLIQSIKNNHDLDNKLKYCCIALKAILIERYDIACLLSIPLLKSPEFNGYAANILYNASEDIFLKGNFSDEQIEGNLVVIAALIKYQSLNPANTEVRLSTSRLLSVEVSASFGYPLAVAIALQIAKNPKNQAIYSSPDLRPDDIQKDKAEKTIKESMKFMAQRGVVEIGITKLPSHIIADDADAVISTIYLMIDSYVKAPENSNDHQLVELLTAICSAAYPYAIKKNNQDLRLIKYIASMYAQKGNYEKARGLAEQILSICGEDTRRLRLAWLCYADVYNRCRNNTEALIGLSCLYSLNTSVDIFDAWDELHALIRVLRDLGLRDHASHLIPALKSLSEKQGKNPSEDLRITALQDSFDTDKALNANAKELLPFLDTLCEKCSSLKNKQEITPIVILIAQCIARLRDFGDNPTQFQISTFEKSIQVCDEVIRDVTNLIYQEEKDITLLAKVYERTRRGENWHHSSNDLNILEIVSRRSISSKFDNIDLTILASEILCDQSLVSIDFEINSLSLTNTLTIVKEQGHSVLYLSLDAEDNLISLFIDKDVNTISKLVGKDGNSYKKSFNKWCDKYPYKYGHVDPYDGNNIFIVSLLDLLPSIPKTESLLVITEPYLQKLPICLASIETEELGLSFLGHQTKICKLPSLSWLASQLKKNSTSYKNLSAWIPIHDELEASTLNVLHQRTSGILEEYDFTLHTTPQLPNSLCNSKISIIGAHGGITPDGEFIHRISDENENILSPQAIAYAVSNCDIVILFICSAGRIDKSPMSNRSYGLPIEILKRGASSVIASPWPLDVKVTYNWLEEFLSSMTNGATVSEANFLANRKVIDKLGHFAGYSLAMTLHGNPDTRL